MSGFRELMDTGKNARAAEKRASPAGGKISGASKYLTPPRVEVPTWEYAFIQYLKSMQTLDLINTECDRMGSYGWEMCERRDSGTGIVRQDTYFTLIFKRRTS